MAEGHAEEHAGAEGMTAAFTVPVEALQAGGEVLRKALWDCAGEVLGGWPCDGDAVAEGFCAGPIGDGTTNALFLVRWPPAEGIAGEVEGKEAALRMQRTQGVLIRVFGEGTDAFVDRERETRIMQELARRGLGPQVLAKFANGRVEQFLADMRPLADEQLRVPEFARRIFSRLVEMHGIDRTSVGIPEDEEARIFPFTRQLLAMADDAVRGDPTLRATSGDVTPSHGVDADAGDGAAGFDMDWLRSQVLWAEETLSDARLLEHAREHATRNEVAEELVDAFVAGVTFSLEIVLCHNDMSGRNVLAHDDLDSVQVIDIEYAGPNPRSFDCGNFFCEFAGLEANYSELYPSVEEQTAMLEPSYIELAAPPAWQACGPTARSAFCRGFLWSTNCYAIMSHLSWALWSISQAAQSALDFDFRLYAHRRLAGCSLQKRTMFALDEPAPAHAAAAAHPAP